MQRGECGSMEADEARCGWEGGMWGQPPSARAVWRGEVIATAQKQVRVSWRRGGNGRGVRAVHRRWERGEGVSMEVGEGQWARGECVEVGGEGDSVEADGARRDADGREACGRRDDAEAIGEGRGPHGGDGRWARGECVEAGRARASRWGWVGRGQLGGGEWGVACRRWEGGTRAFCA